jgi:hypothetical protein
VHFTVRPVQCLSVFTRVHFTFTLYVCYMEVEVLIKLLLLLSLLLFTAIEFSLARWH